MLKVVKILYFTALLVFLDLVKNIFKNVESRFAS